jgi:hypothetical protein
LVKVELKLGLIFKTRTQIPIGLYSFRTKVLFMYEIGMKMEIHGFEKKD